MTGARALLPLLRRPGTLWWLFPLFWAFVLALGLVTESGAPLRALWSADSPHQVRAAAWLLVVIVPASLGAGVAFARLELQHALFSWQLPGLRGALLSGSLLIALPLAAALAWLVGRSAPASSAFAAFAVALCSFTAASSVVDVAIPRSLRWLPVTLLAVAAVRPSAFARLIEQSPLAIALPALALSAVMMTLQFSDRSARIRYVRWSAFAPAARALYWAGRSESVRAWTRSLATQRLGPWLRAAEYEGSGGRFTYPTGHLVMAGPTVLIGHLMSEPVASIAIGAIFLIHGPIRLASTLLYPLSRARRADLAVMGAFIDAATFVTMMAVVLLAVRMVGLPPIPWFEDIDASLGWPATIAMFFAWSPIMQWGIIRWPDTDSRSVLRQIASFVPFGLILILSERVLTGQPWLVLAIATVGIGAIARLLFGIAVRRHYARADLA